MSKTTDSNKQTRETAKKAREIRRRKARGDTYSKIAQDLHILTKEGKPDPGLVYRIGFEGYEPKRAETRERLGLRKLCLACMRGFRETVSRARELSPWRLYWRKLKPEERDRLIREIYEKEKG